ncbi:MAG: YceI family protein [Nitrospira sp.]|nr:YceI family protein [Nitrospira sp.]
MMASLQRGMRIWVLVCSFVLVSAVADAEMARYDIDPEHTTIGFSAVHMLVSNVQGQFRVFSGFIEMDPEAKIVNNVEATIKAWSVNSNHHQRDTHLRSPDFLDVDTYPTMTYKLKSYRKTGDRDTAVGTLTLHGVTKEVTLVGNLIGVTKDPMGNIRAGFRLEGRINRRDFNVNFSATLDNGGMIVSDEIMIKIDMECIKAKTASQ